jgi:hypothetical protein
MFSYFLGDAKPAKDVKVELTSAPEVKTEVKEK